MYSSSAHLNPTQQRVMDLLRLPDQRPPVSSCLVEDLRAELAERLEPVAELAGDHQLFVSKSALSAVNGCEGRWLAERDQPFRWTPAMAKGTVAHKAIGLGLNWSAEAPPARLVDEAAARLENGTDSVGEWLRSAPPAERAEVREGAVNHVTAFGELFPPLQDSWRPATDAPCRAEFADGRIVLRTKPDLTLGHPNRKGKVIVDFKTGGRQMNHRDDLRFYALVDALRVGVAPVRLATLYTESGTIVCEDVTGGVLEAATERVVRSAEALAELVARHRAPHLRPSPLCRFCPRQTDCEPGGAFLTDGQEEDITVPPPC